VLLDNYCRRGYARNTGASFTLVDKRKLVVPLPKTTTSQFQKGFFMFNVLRGSPPALQLGIAIGAIAILLVVLSNHEMATNLMGFLKALPGVILVTGFPTNGSKETKQAVLSLTQDTQQSSIQ
jgi:hypothetical protein